MSLHRRALSVVSAFAVGIASITVAFAPPAQAVDTGVRINEISSDPTDFVELVNLGDETGKVKVSGRGIKTVTRTVRNGKVTVKKDAAKVTVNVVKK